MLAGRPQEAVSNGSRRWMAAGPRERVHRTRPTGPLARRPTCQNALVQRALAEAFWQPGTLPEAAAWKPAGRPSSED